jgi:hypothetical protein
MNHKPSKFQKALRAENRFFAGKTKRGRAWLAKKVANRLAWFRAHPKAPLI